jgi:hypothetical protein
MRPSKPFLSIAALTTAALSAGCAPALSTFQPAHVAPKHHVQAEVGMDVSVPTGTIVDAIETGVNTAVVAAAGERALTDEEIEQIYRAGTGLVLNPPSATPHVGVAFTVIDNLEVGLRYATSSLRLGGRYQFLKKDVHRVDASIGLGVGYFLFGLPLSGLPVLNLDDFTRWQFDVPILFGTHGNWYRVWGGPRFMYTYFSTELNLEIPNTNGFGKVELASVNGHGFYVGAQGGVAIGYKYVFLGFELTLVQMLMRGQFEVLNQPVRDLDMDSFIVYPTIGLMGEF